MTEGDGQEFVIKNGSGNRGDVRVRAPMSGTLLDLKKVLQAAYPGSPQPVAQTVRAGLDEGVCWRAQCASYLGLGTA